MTRPTPRQPVIFVISTLLLLVAGSTEAFSQSDTTTLPAQETVAGEAGARISETKKLTTPFSHSYASHFVDADAQSSSGSGGGQQQGGARQSGGAYVPLTAGEKVRHGFRSAFLRPEGYAFSALSAAITQWREDSQPQKTTEDEVADALSRFARNSATRSTKSVLGSGIYPALFKQDPRYHPSEKKGFGPRALYAVSRVFVTRGDNGESQVNASRLAGTLSASALANIWERSTPGHDRIGVRPTFIRFGRSLAFDALQFVIFREFGPDIKKIFKR